jgi:prepilin-type N-terminal cleavage/methylation domain-containing protein
LRHRARRGFTYVELAVVMLILSVLLVLTLPRIPRIAGSERDEALRRLAYSTQTLYEEAALKKKA